MEEKTLDEAITLDISSFGGAVGSPMLSASECRVQAQKCMDLAENVRSTEKRLLLEIAHTWLKLVRQAEISEVATIPERPKADGNARFLPLGQNANRN